MEQSALGLHLPDADQLTGQEVGAVLELKPAAMLVLCYAQWDSDKGLAQQVTDLVHVLDHNRLYVRFHADPNPPAYAKKIGGAAAWGRLCAERMGQYYGQLAAGGVQLHALLANETDAESEGGLSTAQASRFLRDAMAAYCAERPNDIIHVTAPTGAPETHREHLQQYKQDGWLAWDEDGWHLKVGGVTAPVWIDGHGYNGDLENVLNVLEEECPGSAKVITETNNLDDFSWPIELLNEGRAKDIIYFILNWARGGEGRVQPPTPDDADKQMSLLRFPSRYAQFKATIGQQTEPTPPAPAPAPEPQPMPEFPLPTDDAGHEWKASTSDIQQAILEVAPREIDPSNPRQATKLLLALGIAESGVDLQSQERWHIWTDHGKAAVEQRNLGYAAQVLGWGHDVGAIGTNDYSAGPFHQAWAWWDQFPGNPMDPNDPHRWDVEGWLEFRKRFIQDHGYATTYAARQLKPKYDKAGGDLQETLERYNKPNEEVSAGVRANYARALSIAEQWLTAWGWDEGESAPNAPTPVPAPSPQPPASPTGTTRFETYNDPVPSGTYATMPKGCILHGSRSGHASNPIAAEYAGTANYEVNNTLELGWTATIGDGVVAVHMDSRHWGWNARAASPHYLAVEFAQPMNMNVITDGQVQAFCDWWRTYVLPIWPSIDEFFPTHAEVEHSGETGVRDGKDDVFPYGDWQADALRQRIVANLHAGSQPVPQPQPDPAVPETDAHKVERMIGAIGYLGGDVADRLEAVRAGVDDGMVRPTSSMTKQEALDALGAWWERWDAGYQDIGAVGAELRRVRDEQLK